MLDGWIKKADGRIGMKLFKYKSKDVCLAEAMIPGINATVNSIVRELIDEAINNVKKELYSKISTRVKTTVEKVLDTDKNRFVIDCRITINDE